VDRTFDFSDLDWTKLRNTEFKKKVVKVPAGSFIRCDTCRSIKTCCLGSPVGEERCGQASTDVPEAANTALVTTGVIGQPYRYQFHATDADGDVLAYGIAPHLHGLSVKVAATTQRDRAFSTAGV